MAPEFLKNLRQTGNLGQTAKNVAEDLLVPPIINAVRQQYGRSTSAPAYDPLDERQSPEYMRDQRWKQNKKYDWRHRIDSAPIKDKHYVAPMDGDFVDINSDNDIDVAKDLVWMDNNGKTHRWTVGYIYGRDNDGRVDGTAKIGMIKDKNNEFAPIYGKDALENFVSQYMSRY